MSNNFVQDTYVPRLFYAKATLTTCRQLLVVMSFNKNLSTLVSLTEAANTMKISFHVRLNGMI
jgi:hypothetical protein